MNSAMLKRLQRIATSIVHANPWWEYKRDEYSRPDGTPGEYFYVHTRGSAFCVPVLPDGSVVMVRQYRYLNQRESLEFPGGGIQDSSPADAAQRELAEETGYSCNTLHKLGAFNPFNGVTDEICHVFCASELLPGASQPEASEEFEIVVLSPATVSTYIQSGEIWDGMTIAAWHLFQAHNK